jgi:aldose 1-epimerase
MESSRPLAPLSSDAGVQREPFGTAPNGQPVDAYTLTNEGGLELRFLTYGGVIQCLLAPDRDGALADVVLGYDTLDDYAADPRFLGALVGRYANRIARARFALDGGEFRLEANDGDNHLHGGAHGFHQAVWSARPFADTRGVGAVLHHVSPHGEGGYPGTLDAHVRYTLTHDDALIVDYHAATDRATPVNLTNHTYFNLAGHDAGDVCGHELTVAASRYTPVDARLIPTGELLPVAGTPFDFRTPRAIGERIDATDAQLEFGDGYDHNLVLDRDAGGPGLVYAARLHEPGSGRTVEIFTTEPGLQLYSGNAIVGGPRGKGGHDYVRRAGVALETQHFPDSPNQPSFPSTILRPGAVFASRTVYRFSVR